MSKLEEFQLDKQQAVSLSKSGLLPRALQRKPEDIYVILLQAKELNIPPMQGINSINIIQGKPTVSPQLMIALINKAYPEFNTIKFDINEKESIVHVTMERPNGNKYTAKWDDGKAKLMGLSFKDNYKKQKLTMYRWRAIAEAARLVFPDIIAGMYTPEELDINDEYEYNEDGSIIGKIKPKDSDIKVEPIKVELEEDEDEKINKAIKSRIKDLTNNFEDKKVGEELLEKLGVDKMALVFSKTLDERKQILKELNEE